jgi:hypothetical protein
MSLDDHAAPAPDDPVDGGIRELLAGPSPVNMVPGAIELDRSANGTPRPSQAGIEAARSDILAALWGLEL